MLLLCLTDFYAEIPYVVSGLAFFPDCLLTSLPLLCLFPSCIPFFSLPFQCVSLGAYLCFFSVLTVLYLGDLVGASC